MEEARRVLERLQRIESLREASVSPGTLLGELRALLAEGEAWVAVEGAGTDRARRSFADLGAALWAHPASAEEVIGARPDV